MTAPTKRKPATGQRASAASRSAKARADLGQARAALTRDGFLRSQGPKIIPVDLKEMGATVLMRRIDLLSMAQTGQTFQPIKATLLMMIQDGGVTKDMLDDGSALVDTLRTAAAVAKVACVIPPDDYLSGEVDEYTVRTSDLRPLFVDRDPDEDQVVLANYASDGDGNIVADGDGESGYIHPNDLIAILASAYQFGPGAFGARFRVAAEAVALAAVDDPGADRAAA